MQVKSFKMDELKNLRKEIDQIDLKISNLLKKRQETVIKIRKIKKNNNLKVQDRNREKEIMDKLSSEYQKAVFKKILQESRKLQQDL